MKAIILMFLLSCAINSNATNLPKDTEIAVEKELSEKLHFNLQNFDLQDNRAFVKTSFKVNTDHSITVLESNYSSTELKNELFKQLKEIKLDNVEIGKVYYCKLMFEMK